MGINRDRYEPEGGKALADDDSVFDVTAWRQGISQSIGSILETASVSTIDDYSVTDSSSITVKSSGANFLYFALSNDGSTKIYLKMQAASVDDDKKGIVVYPGELYEMPEKTRYTGEISAISDLGTNSVSVTVY